MNSKHLRFGLLLFVISLAAPIMASANPVVPAELYEVIQKGEDVEITLEKEFVEHDEEWTRSLVRESAENKVEVLFEKRVFSLGDGWECQDTYCDFVDEDFCAENPSSCYDCDQDDELECRNPCGYLLCYLSVIDECVPPGKTFYRLYAYYAEEGFDEDFCSLQSDLNVEIVDEGQECEPGDDSDFECLEPDDDWDTDTEPQESDTEEQDSETEDQDSETEDQDSDTDEQENIQSSSEANCSLVPRARNRSLIAALLAQLVQRDR